MTVHEGRWGVGVSTTDPGRIDMTWAPGPVVTRRRLGGELKRLRDRSGLKLEEVARTLECSQSKISRLENGKGIPKWRDVRDMLEVYGVGPGEERDRLLEWSTTGQQPMWWAKYADVLPPGMATYVELEWDASRIDAYESHIVHGLLQTRDYARAVLGTAWGTRRSPQDVERLVDVRMERQDALADQHGLEFRCVLDQSTLYRVVGSPDILLGQLEHLLVVAEADHVDVRVLPYSAGLVPSSRESFSKLDFSTGIEHGLVYVERHLGGEFLADSDDVSAHGVRWQALLEASLDEQASVPLIEQAVRRVERT